MSKQGSEVVREEQDQKVAVCLSDSQSVYCYLSCTCLYMAILSAHTVCATVESVFVFWVALWADERCVCACTVHQWMLLIPVFFGVQSGISAVSSPHPHTNTCTHTLGCGISILLHAPSVPKQLT